MKIAPALGRPSTIGTNLSPEDLDERIQATKFMDWTEAKTLIDRFIRL
jgi:hypothetical protein